MTAPYWRDYLARERTMCSLCYRDGRGWVRIGPSIPPDLQRPGRRSAFVNRQRADFQRHVRGAHPDLVVRWSRQPEGAVR